MKRLLVTDTHLGLYSDSELWLNIVLNFFKHIAKYCIKSNIKQIIHLGDFFDNRKSLNTKTQHIAHRIARILEKAGLEVIIIVGNHDCYFKNQIHPNTLELFSKYDHIRIIDEPTLVDAIMLVPWGSIPYKSGGSTCGIYCFGHFSINGFHMNDTYICKDGIESNIFSDYDVVLSGHFHTPSNKGNITYLGAPYGQTFHDAGGIRGFHIFDDGWNDLDHDEENEGRLTFIEYEDAPKFYKINTEKLDESLDLIKNNIVRLIFDQDYGTNKNQEIVDKVLEQEPLLYSMKYIGEETEETVEDIKMENSERIADSFIDSQEFSSNINKATLKSMFKKIKKEALE